MDRLQTVVAYCRVSTLELKRRGHGIEIQVRDVTLFAEQQGLFVRRFYRDGEPRGVAEDRKAPRTLLRDCHAGRVRTAIHPSRDRLSRNVRLAADLSHQFEEVGVAVLSADTPTEENGSDTRPSLMSSSASRRCWPARSGLTAPPYMANMAT